MNTYPLNRFDMMNSEKDNRVTTAFEEGHDDGWFYQQEMEIVYLSIYWRQRKSAESWLKFRWLLISICCWFKNSCEFRAVGHHVLCRVREVNYILSTLNEFQFISRFSRDTTSALHSLSNYQNWKLVYLSSMAHTHGKTCSLSLIYYKRV